MTLRIGFLVFPRFQLLDLAGPFDAFATLSGVAQHLIWKDLNPVTATCGWDLKPTATLDDCPALDLLCVPGGAGVNALMEDEAVLDFLRRQAGSVHHLTSVCSGALVLGAAGLLEGRRATTHWASHHLLEPLGAVPVSERIVADGPLITGGGVTAGIDFALTVVSQLLDRPTAEAIQLRLEYNPAPPFTAGSPDTAPPEVLSRMLERIAPFRTRRVEAAERAASRLARTAG